MGIFAAIKTFFVDYLSLMFAWMPSYMAVAFIFLFGFACICVFIKLIVTIIKMIPFL